MLIIESELGTKQKEFDALISSKDESIKILNEMVARFKEEAAAQDRERAINSATEIREKDKTIEDIRCQLVASSGKLVEVENNYIELQNAVLSKDEEIGGLHLITEKLSKEKSHLEETVIEIVVILEDKER